MFAKFSVQRGEEFAERFAVPCHEFGQKERGDGRVALGKIEAESDTAAFFAADENILFEHQFADVFEADGNFVQLAVELCCELVDELCNRKRFGDFAGKISHSSEVPNEQGEDLVWIDEGTVAVDRADAIAIAVGSEPSVVFSGNYCLAQWANVRLNRLGMDAAEARFAFAANFRAGDAVASEEFRQKAGGGSEHCIGNEAEIGFADAVPIDEFFESVEIGRARLKGLDEFWLRRKLRNVGRLDEREFILDLR